MNEYKEVRIPAKKGAVFVARKHHSWKSLKNFYEYFVLLPRNLGCIYPPSGLTQKQMEMSVQDYINHGRDEWFDYVVIGHYARSHEVLNA